MKMIKEKSKPKKKPMKQKLRNADASLSPFSACIYMSEVCRNGLKKKEKKMKGVQNSPLTPFLFFFFPLMLS